MVKFKILCVDDEELNRELLAEILQDDFDVTLASSGLECLDIIKQNIPDLIVLDAMMPKMSGLECCKTIKNNTDTHDVPIIFLSALYEIEDRLKGYLAGAEDYIAKPFNNKEMFAKVSASIERQRKLHKAKSEAQDATVSTLQIINEMGETSAVLAFFQQTFSCKNYKQLANKIIAAHADWGLEIAIEMSINDDRLYFFTNDTALPLEESAFDYIRSKGRLVDQGERTAVNYPRITIIIRNMPLHDQAFYGRIKDYIAIIAQGADSKIITLMAAENISAQQQNLLDIVASTEKAISQLDSEYKEQQQRNKNALTDISATVIKSFNNLGLSEEQEKFLTDAINNAEEKTSQLFSTDLALDEKLSSIQTKIKAAIPPAKIDTEVTIENETADETVAFF